MFQDELSDTRIFDNRISVSGMSGVGKDRFAGLLALHLNTYILKVGRLWITEVTERERTFNVADQIVEAEGRMYLREYNNVIVCGQNAHLFVPDNQVFRILLIANPDIKERRNKAKGLDLKNLRPERGMVAGQYPFNMVIDTSNWGLVDWRKIPEDTMEAISSALMELRGVPV